MTQLVACGKVNCWHPVGAGTGSHLVQDEPRLSAAQVALDVRENIQADCSTGVIGGWHGEAAEVRNGPACIVSRREPVLGQGRFWG